MKKILWLVLVGLLMTELALTSCASNAIETAPAAAPLTAQSSIPALLTESSPASPPAPTPTPPSTTPEDLKEILKRAANVSVAKYDCYSTMADPPRTDKVWVKGSKWRIEIPDWQAPKLATPVSGVNTRTFRGYLIDTAAKTVYAWYSPGNEIEKAKMSPGEVVDFLSSMAWARFVAAFNPKIAGQETRDGKDCLVVEFVTSKTTGKAWIWKDTPFLIRIEGAIAAGITFEFKNISFDDIPDDLFEHP